MKSQFARIKNRARSVSARTLALVLCFVMLISAVSAGAVINSSNVVNSNIEAGSAVADGIDQIADLAGDVAAETAEQPSGVGILINKLTSTAQIAASASAGTSAGTVAGTVADIVERIPSARKSDLAETGRKADLAATGYTSQTGARFYLNAYNRWGDKVQDYVYLAIVRDNNHYASIIKMDHIANTYLYTCVTSNSNMEAKTDVGYIFFFTSSNSGWATKMSGHNDNWYNNVNSYKGTGGMITTSYGMDVYNNHVYYMSINSDNDGVTIDHSESDGNNLAGSTSRLKASQQKASVYVSTTDKADASFAYASSGSVGGDVQVTGYYWDTNFTVAKTTANSSKTNSSSNNYYSYYDNAAMTSWITMKVNEVYDGWTFVGWYDGNTLKSSDTTYYYVLTSGTEKDIKARFFKPTYDTTDTPASATTISKKIIVKKKTDTPENLYIWNTGSGDDSSNWDDTSKKLTQQNSSSYYAYSLTNATNPTAIVRKSDKGKLSGDMTPDNSKTYTDNVYYWELADNGSNGNWDVFTHLGVTLSGNPATADPGEEITLTATKSGTLESGAKLNYYFQKNGEGSWYRIGSVDTTNTTMNFYPPEYGSYSFKVTITDTAGLETAVADSASTTNVGQVGFYVSGDTGLVGSNWGVAPYKGYMTTPSSGTVYTKTFGNVAAGTYEFRITSLTNWVTDSSYSGTYTVDGAAGPALNGNNFTFTITDKKQITITYDSSNDNVTVTTAEVQALDVVVYANTGGFVEVSYGSANFEIPEGENLVIKVAYGDKIDLEATATGGTTFDKWYKNLDNRYVPDGKDGDDPVDISSLEDEVITQRTVYVATFSGGSGSWLYSADSTPATPEIGGEPSDSYNIIYSGSDDGVGRNSGTPHGESAAYISGSNYWCNLTSIFGNPPSYTTLYIALANGTSNSNIVGGTSTKINGTDYAENNGPTIKNSSNENLFTARIKKNNTVNASKEYIEINGIDWTKISALGVLAVYTGSGSVNYKFYYKLAGATAETSTYIPSTNYYAKDASVRNVTGETYNGLQYNFWIYPTRTVVEAVDGQVDVQKDHEANGGALGGYNQWVEGFALKGSQITVTTIIPHRTSYNVTDSNGTTTTVNADEKYYVKGFSFNGVTPQLLKASDGVHVDSFTTHDTDGTTWTGSGTAYSCTYTIPADMKEAKMEITPILFVKDEYASNTVMVYINGYNDSVKNAGWGNTLYVYPFYQYYQNGSSDPKSTYYGQGENFGRYPGQPVINYGGQLFMQIPLTDDASARGKNDNGGPIKGITINNGYYDYVHKDCCNHVSIHRQTYDYDDFAKIYNNKKTKNSEKYLYSIYFSFKYFPENSSKQHRLSTTTGSIDDDKDASRYNDLLASGNILSDTTGTVAAATLTTAGDNSTGWEYLTDALGNNVDIFGNKITNPSAEPLRIFSLGYEYNNAGKWATEWAVYRLNGANYELIYDNAWGIDSSSDHNNKNYNSSIVPSALLYNDKASLAAATSLDGDQPISGYAGLYENLEAYRGVRAMICYEHDIPDNFNPKNYRCDGRWTYTTVDDFVRSSIKIQYYDKDGVLHDDTIPDGSHVGTTTGCSAYFTNSEYYGATTSTSQIINNAESYTFQAEAQGSYEFDGWYMYDTAGHESTISKDSLSANTPRSGNFVLAARFKYVASGKLTISSSMATGSIGRGTAYIGVTVINGDKETVLANVNSNTEPVTIDKSYIKATSNYDIRIEIRTAPVGENQYASYNCYVTDDNDARAAEVRTYAATDPTFATQQSFYNSSDNISTATRTYTLNVKKDIFNETNTQEIKAIAYETVMTPVTYHYDITYWYISRKYGKQAFTKSGDLTSGQINDGTIVDKGTANATTGKKLMNKFLADMMPHESNFNEKIVWDYEKEGNVTQSVTQAGNTFTFTVTVGVLITDDNSSGTIAQPESIAKRTGYFTVPYEVDSTTAGAEGFGIPKADGAGKVAKAASTTFSIDVNYDAFFYTSGTAFVTAPKVIYETVEGEAKERYFKYWEIKTVSSNRGDARVIGKCYYPEFNYRALDNYTITAVYTEDDADTDTYATLYASEAGKTSIAFIGSTRNQWNDGHNGTHSYYAGDLIFNDFILSFKPQSDALFKDIEGAQCGVIIQRLKLIETNASGKNSKTLQEYAADYSAADLTAAKEAATTKAGGSNVEGYSQQKVECQRTDVNDKNRYHFVYSMFISAKKTSEAAVTTGNHATYLYRAYSYMKIGDEYILSDDPAYFYMYDIAQE